MDPSIQAPPPLAAPRSLAAPDGLAPLREAAALLADDRLVPYLGPGLQAAAGAGGTVPLSPEALAAALGQRQAAPGRIRTNLWAVAQFIEQRRHRRTLAAWMAEIFAPPLAPTPFQTALAGRGLGLIVDTWYDGALRAAFAASGRTDWGEIQGITRAGAHRDVWTRGFDAAGTPVDEAASRGWVTLLYKPHGAARPPGQALVADSDYVEVMTEIDIQTPIPVEVRARRVSRGFLFLGCRFHDQMLRTYARQIMKRSAGPHFAVMTGADLTRNERRFLDDAGITLLDLPLAPALERLVG
ncbi:conserved hypothetical protein [Methylobacterium sp. 4-46]|uniref:SIR2 family NAD-dependent protein deacylase n=1 Tax=unclassified Methylobacterium TaxID=2615210 RepID=UPI000152DA4E|nr:MULTISPECIES: SIR2 family protein [Methylobacterium]ACA17978.1 conserved hypothetical protein [Methylobacterium sp. 4-46]WFT77279.1 SIR2 family protein [Methylobacterium nodulans]